MKNYWFDFSELKRKYPVGSIVNVSFHMEIHANPPGIYQGEVLEHRTLSQVPEQVRKILKSPYLILINFNTHGKLQVGHHMIVGLKELY